LKILHIISTDTGGGANASLRLHRGLLKLGVDSKVLILFRRKEKEPEVYEFLDSENSNFLVSKFNFAKKAAEYGINKLKLLGRSDEFEVFSSPKSFVDFTKHPLYEWADLVNLHWVAYFLDYKKYFQNNNKPTVWRTSDLASFTGGCHYPYTCRQFETFCNKCPQLEGTLFKNYAKSNFEYKQEALEDFDDLHIVGVSKWVAGEAKKSKLFGRFPVSVIHNGLDHIIFKPYGKLRSKETFGLDINKKVLGFVVDDLKIKNLKQIDIEEW
jgi:hypothetical protein